MTKVAFEAGMKADIHTDNSKVIERLENELNEYKKTNREIAKDYADLRKQVTQWHDLRKDPNDLPNSDRQVFVKICDVEQPIFDYYRHSLKMWNYALEGEAIAWCEIPKFEED